MLLVQTRPSHKPSRASISLAFFQRCPLHCTALAALHRIYRRHTLSLSLNGDQALPGGAWHSAAATCISTPSLAPLIIASTSRLNDLNLRAGPSRLFLLRTAVFSRARPPAEANSIGNPCKPPFLPGLSGQLLHSSCASFPSVVSPSLAPRTSLLTPTP